MFFTLDNGCQQVLFNKNVKEICWGNKFISMFIGGAGVNLKCSFCYVMGVLHCLSLEMYLLISLSHLLEEHYCYWLVAKALSTLDILKNSGHTDDFWLCLEHIPKKAQKFSQFWK